MARVSQDVTKRYQEQAYERVEFKTIKGSKDMIKELATANHESVSHLINRLLRDEAKRVLGKDMPIPDNNEYMTAKKED